LVAYPETGLRKLWETILINKQQQNSGRNIGWFCGGAFLGVIAGILTRDIATWLSVGIGCGLAVGAGVGGMLEQGKR
jgi:hypothetical protein